MLSKAGSKVEAPVLFSSQSAKKLKLRSPLATVVLKGSKAVPVPNPVGCRDRERAPGDPALRR